jgi:hypothetical protein
MFVPWHQNSAITLPAAISEHPCIVHCSYRKIRGFSTFKEPAVGSTYPWLFQCARRCHSWRTVESGSCSISKAYYAKIGKTDHKKNFFIGFVIVCIHLKTVNFKKCPTFSCLNYSNGRKSRQLLSEAICIAQESVIAKIWCQAKNMPLQAVNLRIQNETELK